jgi:hypothetical protein
MTWQTQGHLQLWCPLGRHTNFAVAILTQLLSPEDANEQSVAKFKKIYSGNAAPERTTRMKWSVNVACTLGISYFGM